ncbi:Transforming acidic coiled-coil-containing protein 1 [Pseudolycoriella hygida]|uniref:Transforming acidic coiled-coil-containing protein 1 n=1 Tax=Pseudolycoriella hygida TaxID=35572 RepID=A0A9Q0RX77_9DIPT|nr:Transforming acidic coiled-coil-containing protein 1 [Pseudolycoriella hygida]
MEFFLSKIMKRPKSVCDNTAVCASHDVTEMKSPKLVKMADQPEMIPNRVQPNKVGNGVRDSAEPPNVSEMSPNISDQCDGNEKTDLSNEKSAVKPIIRRQTFTFSSEAATQELSESVPHSYQRSDSTFVSERSDLRNQKEINPQDLNNSANEESAGEPTTNQDTFVVPNMLSDNHKSHPSKVARRDQDDIEFKKPSIPTNTGKELEINNGSTMVLNSTDFDFLESRGTRSDSLEPEGRDSLLLRFDPLTQRVVQNFTVPASEEKEITPKSSLTHETPSNGTFVAVSETMDNDGNNHMKYVSVEKNGDKVISVDGVLMYNKKVDIDCIDEITRQKMEEYEANQDILLKRIAEKDKAITKSSTVIELYEKAIAEAVAAKENLAQTYEKEQKDLERDRDVNFEHLTSLETTFMDLHTKFERNLQYIGLIQERVNTITEEKSKALASLEQQEHRYDKMKSHAKQQFDIANEKWDQLNKAFSLDNTKLKAQIKREEIHKNAVAEELSQKKKENDELVKICDELISGQKN